MRTIICTTGTSIARGCEALTAFQKGLATLDTEANQLRDQIANRLKEIDLTKEEDRVRASAEINSLHRLKLEKEDRVVLLCTDTIDGEICGESVAQCLEDHFDLEADDVVLQRIEGLQVRDTKLLRSTGLPRLIDAIWQEVDDARNRGSEVILNPTGGFKGIVPFVTVIGMLRQIKTVYIFEFTESLISLPPLPITFDLNLFYRARPALELFEQEVAVMPEQFFSKIDNFHSSEKELFAGFLEPLDHKVTLSPMAFALLRMDEQGARNIFLSPEVAALLNRSEGLNRINIERFLTKIAQPAWRSMHYHSFPSTDLNVFKPGSVGERAACIVDHQDGKVFVCCFYLSHDEYERQLPGRKRSEFDLDSFEEWAPDLELAGLNAAAVEEHESQLDELISERNELRNKLRDASQPFRDEIHRLKSRAGTARGLKLKNAELKNELEIKTRELKSALHQLEAYKEAT